MEFLKTSNAFAHSNGEVRDAARDVCVALHICVGRGELSRYLSILRPKQREEYEQAFSAAGPEHVLHPPASTQTQAHVGARRRAQDGPSNDRIEEIDARAQKSGSPRESEYNRDLRDKAVKAEEDVAGEGFTQCMVCSSPHSLTFANACCMQFCHARNQKWDEDALDLHYWRECAMLMSCPACTQVRLLRRIKLCLFMHFDAQIVETSDISQHLVGECESSTLYAIDDVTGLAVSRSEIVNWKNGPHCRPVPDGHALCPLCFEEVPASEDGWKMHLSYECLRNPRLAVQA
jgi:centrosomal protein CEP104